MPESRPHMADYTESLRVLRKDPRFSALIRKHGPPQLKPRGETGRISVFDSLLRAIIYQQLSGKAAATILMRFKGLYGPASPLAAKGTRKYPTPAQVCAMPVEKLRSAGLSQAKALYIKDLAEKFASGAIKHRSFSRMESGEIIEHLLQIKGVGIWTVQMLLIFTLARLDILPVGDLGVRKGFMVVYKLEKLPTPAEMERLAKPWRAHASVASWYLWRVADGVKHAAK
jgi:DNA-3-methyladenine glycosylase II